MLGLYLMGERIIEVDFEYGFTALIFSKAADNKTAIKNLG